MARIVFIACEEYERELESVAEARRQFQESGFIVVFPPSVGPAFHGHVERTINRCEVFLAVVGEGINAHTWLNDALRFAWDLSQQSERDRPEIVGLRIGAYEFPAMSRDIQVRWLHAEGGDPA